MEALAEVLPLCGQCRCLNLSRNLRLGDRGVVALARAVAKGVAPQLMEVHMQHNHLGPESAIALRRCMLVRETKWFV